MPEGTPDLKYLYDPNARLSPAEASLRRHLDDERARQDADPEYEPAPFPNMHMLPAHARGEADATGADDPPTDAEKPKAAKTPKKPKADAE